jgi:hypothetical protein
MSAWQHAVSRVGSSNPCLLCAWFGEQIAQANTHYWHASTHLAASAAALPACHVVHLYALFMSKQDELACSAYLEYDDYSNAKSALDAAQQVSLNLLYSQEF